MPWNGRSPIGRVARCGVGGCWTTTSKREFCGSNTLEYKLVSINPQGKVAECANQYGVENTSKL